MTEAVVPREAESRPKTVPAKHLIPLRVRDASLDDYPRIAELESRYQLQTKPRDEWEHLWVNNPVYRTLVKSWPVGWVLEGANRKIVGYLGNIPLSYELKGKKLLAASSRAWVVDSEYRGYSPLLLDYFFAQSNVDLFLTTTLNSEASEGFQSFGPSAVPAGDWDHSSFWITNYKGFLASSLRLKKVPFAKPLSYPLSLLPFFIDQLRSRTPTEGKQVQVQLCSAFDERFDSFWEELRNRRAQVLLGTRTREILNWHFKYALLRGEAWIFCVSKGARLLAYSIFYRQDNIKLGLKRLRLAEFQTLQDDQSLLVPMLTRALERCRRAGIHILEILGVSPQNAQILAKLAPHRRNLSSWLAFYKTNNPQLAASLKDPKRWDLSCFDGDISL